MRTFLQSFAVGAMLAFVMTPVAFAADAADPAVGTWKLNLEKSKFSADQAPKSMTRIYATAPDGMSMTVTGVANDGSSISQSATLTYDGKNNAFTGSKMWDSVSLKRVNGSTVKSELKKDGKVVGHSTRTISARTRVGSETVGRSSANVSPV